MEIPTPDYTHVSDYKDVYEPAEDTFLLLDALEKEKSFLESVRPTITVEVGSGSGVVSAFVSKILGNSALYFCTDRNHRAALCSNETFKVNKANVNVVVTDLVSGLLPKLKNSVDLLIFNPPYVVTPSDEIKGSGITASWAGGMHGREVMDKFFQLVPTLLSDKGVLYLVVIKENKPDEIKALFSNMGFLCDVVMTRRSGPEFLMILKFTRKSTNNRTDNSGSLCLSSGKNSS
nr:hemK methyltransferase family member 2-like isoform X2 [Ciona intestinalis]|eukprot:XP_009862427.1 hemK methyltransferase family member 2-like isoform X2 [Ciona intestinalis]